MTIPKELNMLKLIFHFLDKFYTAYLIYVYRLLFTARKSVHFCVNVHSLRSYYLPRYLLKQKLMNETLFTITFGYTSHDGHGNSIPKRLRTGEHSELGHTECNSYFKPFVCTWGHIEAANPYRYLCSGGTGGFINNYFLEQKVLVWFSKENPSFIGHVDECSKPVLPLFSKCNRNI